MKVYIISGNISLYGYHDSRGTCFRVFSGAVMSEFLHSCNVVVGILGDSATQLRYVLIGIL